MAAPTSLAQIRKLRKKLRQIENLERLTRPLDDLEQIKVAQKYDVRDRLQELLNQENIEEQREKLLLFSAQRPEAVNHASNQLDEDSAQTSSSHTVEDQTPDLGDTTQWEVQAGGRDKGESGDPGKPEKESSHYGQDSFKPKKVKDKKSQKEEKNPWSQRKVLVSQFDGHSDLVTSVFIQGMTLVSASRDTTVKVWDLQKGEETFSLGGHAETVTSVIIISPEESSALFSEAELIKEGDSVVVSGSTDCMLKLWSLNTGYVLKSVYTFNPVTCLDYSYTTHHLVSTSDGGKIELFDLKSGTNAASVRAHENRVTGLKVLNETVITGDSDGLVMVHEIRGGSLVRIFVSEDVKLVSGSGKVNQRMIRSLTAGGRTVVYGDDSRNIKILDWRKGLLSKVLNHVDDFASTDALYLWEDILLSSSFDLDIGSGYINVRSFSTGQYLASLHDEAEGGTERIMCLSCTQTPSGSVMVVSGGQQLKAWEVFQSGKAIPEESDDNEKWATLTQYLPPLAKAARDSDAESDNGDDSNDGDDESEEESGKPRCFDDEDTDLERKSYWMSWCSLM